MAGRSFLFLQGPQSRFFERVARVLTVRGHSVHRVNFNLGDRLYWRLPGTDFRGRFEDWPDFVARLLEARTVTDLILLGDRRPYHIIAAEAARARGAIVWAADLGYVRPGWLTLEEDGLTGFSHFPRDPAVVHRLAQEFPEPDFAPVPETSFWQLAVRDVAYNVSSVLGRPLYPHYRRHSLYYPFAEYAGWMKNAPRRFAGRRATAAAKARLAAAPQGSYFLFPLQLATDFQLRSHSSFGNAREAFRLVLQSFAKSGSPHRLIIVAHPLDEGLIDWRPIVAGHERITFLEGGVTNALVANAAGVVTINSTVGLTALRHGVPVKALGTAIYDIVGLTHPGDLAGFWHDPRPPDQDLLTAFLRALIGATQIRGGHYRRAAQDRALPGFVARLENGPYPMAMRSTYSAAANDGG